MQECRCLFKLLFSFPFSYIPQSGIAESCIVLIKNFFYTTVHFNQQSTKISLSAYSCQQLLSLVDSHSKRCEIISHCGFDLHHLGNQQRACFMLLLVIWMSFFPLKILLLTLLFFFIKVWLIYNVVLVLGQHSDSIFSQIICSFEVIRS